MNRCRFHIKAEKQLMDSLKKDPQDLILKAYLVSNYVHQENLEEAKNIYQKEACFLCNEEIAYFYRNSGAIYWNDLTPLEKAIEIFEKCDDLFGLYSSECNLITRKWYLIQQISIWIALKNSNQTYLYLDMIICIFCITTWDLRLFMLMIFLLL